LRRGKLQEVFALQPVDDVLLVSAEPSSVTLDGIKTLIESRLVDRSTTKPTPKTKKVESN
jgi:hypothetical protein